MTGDREGKSELEARRARCLYRARHRGTKEMDWLLERSAAHSLPLAEGQELAAWERLVETPDPLLYDWIVNGAEIDDQQLKPIIEQIKTAQGA